MPRKSSSALLTPSSRAGSALPRPLLLDQRLGCPQRSVVRGGINATRRCAYPGRERAQLGDACACVGLPGIGLLGIGQLLVEIADDAVPLRKLRAQIRLGHAILLARLDQRYEL